jgi:lipoprotein-anchoring transpeptidase ErfK/SrfK
LRILALTICFALVACGKNSNEVSNNVGQGAEQNYESTNRIDELNPFASDIEQQMAEMDAEYESQTGSTAFVQTSLESVTDSVLSRVSSCTRDSCTIWARVNKAQQLMYLYENGILIGTYPTSSGAPGFDTPDFDRRPNGRIYDKYTSKAYPGGDYKGLGNMPYAVFIEGGFAIHGTGKSNWKRLGSPASHGCIRIHPDNALIFNRLVRKYGIYQTWITVE